MGEKKLVLRLGTVLQEEEVSFGCALCRKKSSFRTLFTGNAISTRLLHLCRVSIVKPWFAVTSKSFLFIY